MKILLIGKTGQLGGDIMRNSRGHEIHAPGRDELDICDPGSIERALEQVKPDAVINTAAFHNVPACETDPLTAFKVNCVAVRDLAGACERRTIRIVTFSSDYVFGGGKRSFYKEDDLPAPLQIYGISRVAGEYAALSSAPNHAIVIRTCGLYGRSGARSKGGNFVDKRVEDARTLTSLEMSCEQIVSPTSTNDLSKAVLQLIDHPGQRPGVYHLVNEGQCSWYEFTRAIYATLGLPVEVKPVDRGGRSGDMRRPLFSALANTKAKALGIVLPPWRDALNRYLNDTYASSADR